MTDTEQRLADALRTVATSVDEATLTPLRAPAPRSRRRWAIRLAPAFAAAGVALAVTLGLLISPGPPHHPAVSVTPTAVSGTPTSTAPTGAPRYYADIGLVQTQVVEFRATATSKITAIVPSPRVKGEKYPLVAWSVAAEPGDRTFIAAYSRIDNFPPYATWLFRIQLNSAGRVTGFAQFTYGVVDNLGVLGEMSISPDGSTVAFPTCHLSRSTGEFCEVADEIEVVDLATGTQTLYQGGLPPVKAGLSIKDVSWAPNGHTLVFLALWCHTLLAQSDACGSGTNLEQVRTLTMTSGGHSLGQGSILLGASARYPNIVQAVLNPDGSSLMMLVGHGPVNSTYFTQSMVMEQLPLTPAGQPSVLYRGTFYGQDPVELATDSSGRYWLMVSGLDRWIGPGGVHHLKPNYEDDLLAW